MQGWGVRICYISTLAKSEKFRLTNVTNRFLLIICPKLHYDFIKRCYVPLAPNTEKRSLQLCVFSGKVPPAARDAGFSIFKWQDSEKGRWGGEKDLGLKVKTGCGITKITIGIAGLIEIWVGITGLNNPMGGSLGILISNMIRLVEHLLPWNHFSAVITLSIWQADKRRYEAFLFTRRETIIGWNKLHQF